VLYIYWEFNSKYNISDNFFNLPIENTSNLFSTSLNAGSGATFASDSNFFGQNAGYGATGASNSNFFGKMLVMGQQALNFKFLGPTS
jgi:hypothetical protein